MHWSYYGLLGLVGMASADTCGCDNGTGTHVDDCTTGTNCASCISGYFLEYEATFGTSQCTVCSVGFKCAGGSIVACSDTNEYQDATGQSDCIPVPAGSYKVSSTSIATKACTCVGGDAVSGGACSTTEAKCASCNAGRFLSIGSMLCDVCPEEKFQSAVGKEYCDWVPAGEYANGDKTATIVCPIGFMCAGGASEPCDGADEYQDATGQSDCNTVPAGSYKVSSTSIATKTCTCVGGDAATGGMCTNTEARCASCEAGRYLTTISGSCTICEIGFMCEGGNEQMACFWPNLYQDLVGQSDCKTVPAGSYKVDNDAIATCDVGFMCAGGSAVECDDANEYQPNSGSSICFSVGWGNYKISDASIAECLSGFFCDGSGTTVACSGDTVYNDEVARGDCKPVPAGSYKVDNDAIATKACSCGGGTGATGTQCNNHNEVNCASCEPGRYLNSNICVMCAAGFMCLGGSDAMVPCSNLNEYQNLLKQSSCNAVEGGHFKTNNTHQQSCQCADGVVDMTTTCTIDSSHCSSCNNGFFWDTTSTVCAACTCDNGSAVNCNNIQSACTSCDNGFYLDGITNDQKCIPCDPGSYIGTDGVCTICTTGNWCLNGTKNECGRSGYQTQTQQTSCISVGEGYYTGTTAQTTAPNICEAGNKCSGGVKTPCARSEYQNMTRQSTCHNVSGGYYTEAVGAIAQKQCEIGYRCVSGEKLECSGNMEYQDLLGESTCKGIREGFRSNADNTGFERNTCSCVNGTAPDECSVHNTNECGACDLNFILMNKHCIVNQCLDNDPCENNGVCSPGNIETCSSNECEENTDGPCITSEDVCLDLNPNSNECDTGTEKRCIPYTCACEGPYTGANCSTYDYCSGCLNGGTCNNTTKTCTCGDGFYGENCAETCETSDECGHGTCVNKTCGCADGYGGTHCELHAGTCTINTCRNGGKCETESKTTTSCTCAPGFNGTRCENNVDDCAHSDCMNGATCIDGDNSYTCDCVGEWSGEDCSQQNLCPETDDCDHGTCVSETETSYSCECDPGWEGDECDENMNECETNPCKHGICIDKVNNFECVCDDSYTGSLCEVALCENNYCSNGGMCLGDVTQHRCVCVAGFEGVSCETNIDDCDPSPCESNYVCTDGINSHTCDSDDEAVIIGLSVGGGVLLVTSIAGVAFWARSAGTVYSYVTNFS
jgi:hypothetical protein